MHSSHKEYMHVSRSGKHSLFVCFFTEIDLTLVAVLHECTEHAQHFLPSVIRQENWCIRCGVVYRDKPHCKHTILRRQCHKKHKLNNSLHKINDFEAGNVRTNLHLDHAPA